MNKRILFRAQILGIMFLSFACNDNGPSSSPGPNSTPLPSLPTDPTSYAPVTSGPNVLPVQVGGGSLCGLNGYLNEPCTTVTVCVPSTTNCQTISDVLVDTGSTGLRIFSSALTLSLPAVTDSSQNQVAECAQFGTGSDWGPLVTAEVVLGSEPGVQTSIQVINKAFATAPSACSNADISPQAAGYNGILGVGLFKQDCGTYCANQAANELYYGCRGTSCTSEALSLASQLQNPISLLPTDNNGLVFELPMISPNGMSLVTGSIVLGIGTQSNNTPSSVTAYAADIVGNFTTTFNGQSYTESFIDSGSNGLFFPSPSALASCASSSPLFGFFCPAYLSYFKAVNVSSTGTPQNSVNFQISSAEALAATGNVAFNNLGGGNLGGFDWGLPFFFGRKVYVGIENTTSTLGMGPYWAY